MDGRRREGGGEECRDRRAMATPPSVRPRRAVICRRGLGIISAVYQSLDACPPVCPPVVSLRVTEPGRIVSGSSLVKRPE